MKKMLDVSINIVNDEKLKGLFGTKGNGGD
jgi:hypothetical protein